MTNGTGINPRQQHRANPETIGHKPVSVVRHCQYGCGKHQEGRDLTGFEDRNFIEEKDMTKKQLFRVYHMMQQEVLKAAPSKKKVNQWEEWEDLSDQEDMDTMDQQVNRTKEEKKPRSADPLIHRDPGFRHPIRIRIHRPDPGFSATQLHDSFSFLL
uniref:Uncharacterized protein n=1 Tax=Romanomermis culicivorax TaxID=13658 RepID=A0A915JIC3_ROMCU